MPGVRHVIEIVGGDSQHRAEREVIDPFLVQIVEALQIVGCDGAFVVAPAAGDAVQQGGDGSPKIDDQVWGRQEAHHGFVQLAVGLVIALFDVPLHKQVPGEDLRILIQTAVLHHRVGML